MSLNRIILLIFRYRYCFLIYYRKSFIYAILRFKLKKQMKLCRRIFYSFSALRFMR